MTGLLAVDNRPRSPRGGIMFRPAWAFKGETKDFLREQLAGAPGPIVHLCAGSSRIGDVRMDIAHPGAHVRADVRRLPFRDVGTFIMDPPWGLALDERARYLRDVGRSLQVGGLFFLLAPWMPALLWADLEGAWVRHQVAWKLPENPILLTRWRKHGRPPRRVRHVKTPAKRSSATGGA